jgi:glycosyltransferase involved in cell wall biosynthesis
MKSIAVLATLINLRPSYSINSIVKDKVHMMAQAGYAVRLLVLEGFVGKLHSAVEVRPCLPQLTLPSYSLDMDPLEGFDADVDSLHSTIQANLDGIDVCITEDLLYRPQYLHHNAAVRRVGDDIPRLQWVHWIYNAPLARPQNLKYPHTLRFTGMPRSRFVLGNRWQAPLLAEMYNVPESDVSVVYNARDPRSLFDLDSLTCDMIERHTLLEADVICVYPTRLAPEKQIDHAMRLIARIKAHGCSVRLIVCNTYTRGKALTTIMKGLIALGNDLGLDNSELIFTSQQYTGWRHGTSKRVVQELLRLSNLFILPSVSEGCSLSLLEGAMAKPLVVLNEDSPGIREFGESNALYMKFGNNRFRSSYYEDTGLDLMSLDIQAKRIIDELQANKALAMFTSVRKRFNYDWIMQEQLAPLLESTW